MQTIKVAPSLLAADYAYLAREIRTVERAGADMLHVDVMDGHFVNNITIGPLVVEAINRETNLPLDVHLMIENPQNYINAFAKAGSDIITIHAEACPPAGEAGSSSKEILEQIKSLGLKAGISINPPTPLSAIKDVLGYADLVLIMSVNPGLGGQKFIKEVVPKIRELKGIYNKDIEVDGGINLSNAKEVVQAGANILVAGNYIFKATSVKQAIRSLKECQK